MVTGSTVFGGWVCDDAANGLRRFPYDENFPIEQVNFGLVPSMKPYEIGELWCAFLLDVTRRIGRNLGLRLVIDAMKGLMSNPGLLDGRNHILLKLARIGAATTLTRPDLEDARAEIWAAAAKFGMGVGALSNGATATGIVADTSVP
jgi:extracellular elastinolytic metalloproteinase